MIGLIEESSKRKNHKRYALKTVSRDGASAVHNGQYQNTQLSAMNREDDGDDKDVVQYGVVRGP